MHQTSTDPIVARFTFTSERASEFLDDGRLVTQIDCDSVEEVMTYLDQFGDAIVDCSAIVDGKVVNLSDHSDEA